MKDDVLATALALGFSEEEFARAQELGIDLGILAENKKLTPTEQANQHDRAVREVLKIQRELGKVRDGR